MPTRIQLQTRHGWRKPHGTVVVTATSKWANPWRLGPTTTRESIVEAYRRWLLGYMGDHFLHEREVAVASLPELRGRDLACWCPLDEPCHADVLLEIANAQQVTELTLAR
jgi:hypothetical protein